MLMLGCKGLTAKDRWLIPKNAISGDQIFLLFFVFVWLPSIIAIITKHLSREILCW